MASELRALTQSKGEMSSEAPGVVKRQAAA